MFHFNSHARVGRDQFSPRIYLENNYFNSHARVGRDISMESSPMCSQISTHTPV